MAEKQPKEARAPRWWQDPQYRTGVFPTAGTAEDTRRRPGRQDFYTPEEESSAKLWLVGIFKGPLHVGTIASVNIAAIAGDDAEAAESIAHQIAGDPTGTMSDWTGAWDGIPEANIRKAVKDLRDNPQFEPEPSPATGFTGGHRAPSGEAIAYWWQDKRYHLATYPHRYTDSEQVCAWTIGVFNESAHVGDIGHLCGTKYQRAQAEELLKNLQSSEWNEIGVEDLRREPQSTTTPKPAGAASDAGAAVDPGAPDPAPGAEDTETGIEPWWEKDYYRLELVVAPSRHSATIAAASIYVVREYEDWPSMRAALLLSFLTGPDVDAAKAVWRATRFMYGGAEAKVRADDSTVIDWRDQPEPADPRASGTDRSGLSQTLSPYHDLRDEFENLSHLIERAGKAAPHRLAGLFAAASLNHEDISPATTWPESTIRRCVDEFHAQDEPTKRRILNGWSSESVKPYRRDEIGNCVGETDLACVLTCHAPQHVGFLVWSFDTVMDGQTYPVRVNIRAGAPRQQVMQALKEITTDLQRRWDDLIVDPRDVNGERRKARVAKEKKKKAGAA